MKKLFFSLFSILLVVYVKAQSPLDTYVDLEINEKLIEDILIEISEQTEINISFSNNILPKDKKHSLSVKNEKIGTVLQQLLAKTDVRYKLVDNQIVLYYKKRIPKKYTISGYVEDQESSEKLIGASVFDRRFARGTVTNDYGFYSLTLPEGKVELSFSYLGYEGMTKTIDLSKNIKLDLALNHSLILAEIIVVANDSMIQNNEEQYLSKESTAYERMKTIPSLGGEPDILRTSYLLAGVQTGADGVGGLHVRGGSVDQNLILLDGVPIYNASHAIGAFSVFNPSVLRSTQLWKGNFPARYGGRLSSILDVRTKEGNQKEYDVELGVGITTAKMVVEGPIIKGKSSFLISARKSLIGLFTDRFADQARKKRGEEGETDYGFYDMNLKLNYNLGSKDKVYLSLYRGNDRFEEERSILDFETYDPANVIYQDTFNQELSWGNTIAAFRWNHVFGNRWFANTTLTYSNYRFKSSDIQSLNNVDRFTDEVFFNLTNVIQYRSNIEDWAAKIDLEFIPNPVHYLRFGVSGIGHKFQPGAAVFRVNDTELDDFFIYNSNFVDTLSQSASNISQEYAAYFEDEIVLSPLFTINAGFHSSLFVTGQKKYFSIQPRLSLNAKINKDLKLSASLSKMTQFLHLLTASGIGLPSDLWVPSTDRVKPQQSWIGVLGAQYNWKRKYNFSVELYYKKMSDVIAYEEGTSLISVNADNWENKITTGKAWSYGVELSVSKNIGRTTGWINYTWAHAKRQFEELNFGETFPFKFDRRHNLKLSLQHKFNKTWSLSGNWVYGTGISATIPVSKYRYEDLHVFGPIVINYDSKNSFRFPAYHRLDLALNCYLEADWGEQNFSLSIYNVYGKRNPLYYSLQLDHNSEFKYVQALLFPIVPSLSYTIKF